MSSAKNTANKLASRSKNWAGKGVIALGLTLGAGGGLMLATQNGPPVEKMPSAAFRPLPAHSSKNADTLALAQNAGEQVEILAAKVELHEALALAEKKSAEATQKEKLALEQAKSAAPKDASGAVLTTSAGSLLAATTENHDSNSASTLALTQNAVSVANAPRLPCLQKRSITDRVRPGETLSVALTRHGVSMDEVNLLVAGLKGTLDVRGIRPGDSYTVEQIQFSAPQIADGLAAKKQADEEKSAASKTLAMHVFKFRPASSTSVPTVYIAAKSKDGKAYRVEKQVAEVEVKLSSVSGSVNSSLYVAMTKRGEGPTLVNRFVDVFGWDVDFYRETQRGDTYKVVVEKKYAEGRFVGYGKVLAAEYINSGHSYRGFWFESKDKKIQGLFTQDGNAMEKTFLKNPMEIARVTSSYGQRFHPVLRRLKSHNGVDYGASRGTPYWAVADGTVVKAHYSRTAGNMIVLRHANGYETQYFHSKAFAKGIRVGAKVKQRQVIGYVGTTGRSTGPHLHFGMKKAGRYVNPSRQNFPAAKPVPAAYTAEYKAAIAELLAEIEAMENS